MAHLIGKYDNMVSRDLKPWHGLGVVWKGPMDTKTVMEQSGLTWRVIEREAGVNMAYEYGKGGDAIPVYKGVPGYKVLLREDMAETYPLGIVTERYSVLQNVDIFEAFDPLVADGILEWETAGSLRNGRTVWALGRFRQEFEQEITPGDYVRKYVLLTTTHDGTGKAVLQPTPIRVVCNNTLQQSLRQGATLEFSHIGNISSRVSSAANALVRLGNEFDETIGYFRDMSEFTMTADEREAYFKMVLPDAPKRAKHGTLQDNINAKRNTWEKWTVDAPENRSVSSYRPDSLWSAMSAVTRFSTHAVGSRVQDQAAYAIEGGGSQLGRQAMEVAKKVLLNPELLEV